MIALRSPDLLDRRALALLRLVDVYGRTIAEPVRIAGDGIRSQRKADGTIAITAAAGFDSYGSAFIAPASPGNESKAVPLDLMPISGELDARRFTLRLPRSPDPATAGDPGSIFQGVVIEMLPGAAARLTGSACALRVTVTRKSDKRVVQNALVRARSEDEQFIARGLTDARGEATLIFPALPIAFPGAGAKLKPGIEARVVVTVDAESARFNDPAADRLGSESRTAFADPDDIGSEAPDFANGTAVGIAAGREVGLTIEWTSP